MSLPAALLWEWAVHAGRVRLLPQVRQGGAPDLRRRLRHPGSVCSGSAVPQDLQWVVQWPGCSALMSLVPRGLQDGGQQRGAVCLPLHLSRGHLQLLHRHGQRHGPALVRHRGGHWWLGGGPQVGRWEWEPLVSDWADQNSLDCGEGCPGTIKPCDDRFFSIQDGKCIDVSVPGAIPNWFGAPSVRLGWSYQWNSPVISSNSNPAPQSPPQPPCSPRRCASTHGRLSACMTTRVAAPGVPQLWTQTSRARSEATAQARTRTRGTTSTRSGASSRTSATHWSPSQDATLTSPGQRGMAGFGHLRRVFR